MDGIHYNVVISSAPEREFSLTEGNNSGTALSGRTIRDILGTAYGYQIGIEPNPHAPEDYDAMYEKISEPVDTHTIIMPYGQSEIEFEAMIVSGKDELITKRSGRNIWGHMKIHFVPVEPQRR